MKSTFKSLYCAISDLVGTILNSIFPNRWKQKLIDMDLSGEWSDSRGKAGQSWKANETKHFADGFHEVRWEDDLHHDIHGNPYDPKKGVGDKQYDFAEDDEILGI